MKRIASIILLALTGCASIPRLPWNKPAVPAAVIAAGNFARPVVSVDGKGVVRVAAEGPKMDSIHLWTWTGKAWEGVEIVRSSPSTASRVYVPDIEGGIVSWRYGNKEGGPMRGPGYWQDGKTFYPGLTEGAARLATSDAGTILMSKGGEWINLDTGARGRYPAGLTGEKFDFAIDRDTWATAHNGFSGEASRITIGGKGTTWASYAEYPDQGNDLNYPCAAIADGAAWAAAVYAGRVCVNSWDGKALGWPATALLDLGPATMQERCPPRLYALSGAVYAVWQHKGAIYRKRIPDGPQERLATGTMPAVAADGERVFMAYISDGNLTVKIIEGEQGND